MSLLQKSFQVVDMENFTASKPKMLGLSRTVATELVLLAVLSPLIVSDIAAEFGDRIFATDASLAKGAIVSAQIGPNVPGELSDQKGVTPSSLHPFSQSWHVAWILRKLRYQRKNL